MRTEYLMEKEVERVLMALMPSNRLVCRVCLHTGLRVSDVLELRPWQIARQFWIVEKKTGKRRRVNLTGKLVSEMRSESGGSEWVFPGRDYRKHRTRQAVWQDVKRAAKAFRLPQNVAPHSFRKVYAVELLRRYGDIERVRKAMNHSSTSVAMIYAMAAATAGGGPGNPAGREKKSTSHGVARRIARRLVDMCRAAMIGWVYHVGGRCELTRY